MTQPQHADDVLRLEDVVVRYGNTTVINGLSLSIRAHETVVLIGASGSGKSTLLRTVNLIERVSDGQIFLNGTDITDPRVDANDVRARIGIVFQQYNLFPHLDIRSNITLGCRHALGWGRREANDRADELLDRIGLADRAGDYPDRLSGGQQQRVAIARAIAGRPEILLLDEVTSALDPQLVGDVLDLIGELKASGVTIVMATHELSFAREVADRVAFLSAGTILEEGAPRQVLDAPRRHETAAFLSRAFRTPGRRAADT